MDPAVVEQLLKGAIPPGVFALLIFGLLWLKVQRPSIEAAATEVKDRNWRHTYAPLFAVAVIFLSWPIAFTLSFPPADTFARLPWILLVLAIAQCGIDFIPHRIVRRWIAAIPVVLAAWFVVPAAQRESFSVVELIGVLLCAMLSIGWTSHIAARSPRLGVAVQLIVLAGASQVLILTFTSLKLGQAAGMLAAIAGAVLILTLWKKRDLGGRGLEAFLMSGMLLTLYAGVHSSDVKYPWKYLGLISAAPAAAAAMYLVPLKSDRLRVVLAGIAVIGVVGAAVAIAFLNQPTMDY